MNNLKALTDQELLHKKKQLKVNKTIDALIIGFTIGIFIYTVVKHGFGFFTFFPLIIAYLIIRNSKSNKLLEHELDTEITSRNLK